MLTEISPKPPKYFCDYCNLKTNNKKDYENHLSTLKHSKLTNDNKSLTGFPPKNIISNFICENCNKEYKSRVGLWKHKKICAIDKKVCDVGKKDDLVDKDQLILMLIKQNSEFQNSMLEVIKNGTNNNNTTHTNSHNKTFNLQFFLNEECKNALNISEFVSSIKMDLNDLETTGTLGYSEGISNIINKNLNCLDQTKRPIHCSDVKREVFYVKNDDQWIKENGTNKPVLTKAIKQVAHENIRQISEWRKKYPDCCDPDSTKNDVYLNIVSNAMSGSTSEEQVKNYEKIISNVAKEVIIDKEVL